jgi:hypothetical protein
MLIGVVSEVQAVQFLLAVSFISTQPCSVKLPVPNETMLVVVTAVVVVVVHTVTVFVANGDNGETESL